MNLHDVERRCAELERHYQAGELTSEDYDALLAPVMAQDDTGSWWTKQRGSGAWCVYDGADWVAGNPFQAVASQAPAQHQRPALAYAAPGGVQVAREASGVVGGLAYVYYVLALVPLIGVLLWLGYRKSAVPANRSMASTIGVISLISAILGVVMNLS